MAVIFREFPPACARDESTLIADASPLTTTQGSMLVEESSKPRFRGRGRDTVVVVVEALEEVVEVLVVDVVVVTGMVEVVELVADVEEVEVGVETARLLEDVDEELVVDSEEVVDDELIVEDSEEVVDELSVDDAKGVVDVETDVLELEEAWLVSVVEIMEDWDVDADGFNEEEAIVLVVLALCADVREGFLMVHFLASAPRARKPKAAEAMAAWNRML